MCINENIWKKKGDVLGYFRGRSGECCEEVRRAFSESQYKDRASESNKKIEKIRDSVMAAVKQSADSEDWDSDTLLRSLLTVMYASDVVMLEARNSFWQYDYMSFSRRIGELWEPFCKTCFYYSAKPVSLFVPPLFSDVKQQMTSEIERYIDKLSISEANKAELKEYYRKVWSMVASGEVQLELDLHFAQEGKRYNVDFKSGFGSNEKGNTNRLLLVATIFKNISPDYENILLVRANEDSNNQYFQRLKKSGIWSASCGKEAYDKMKEFTGFDLRGWIDTNIDWENDMLNCTVDCLKGNGLMKYLEW